MPLSLVPSTAVEGPVRRHAQLTQPLQGSGPSLVLATLLPHKQQAQGVVDLTGIGRDRKCLA